MSPLLLLSFMWKDKVNTLLENVLNDNKSLFLIDFRIGSDNTIKIVIDGDQGVTLQDCMMVSRAIEHNLDREEADFSLEVTSAGATEPLTMPRQYTKNIGRKMEVRTSESSYEGNLTVANQETITLEWKAREPKPIGKGKITIVKNQEIPYSDIVKAKVVLKF